jgi:rod shape-determining protein MreD
MLKKRLIYFAVVLLALIIQVSVLPVFFSYQNIPQIMLMLVIAGTIIFGFHRVLPWVIFGGILLDLISYQRVGLSVILFVLVSYFVSFISRRFLVENKNWGFLIMIFFIAVATAFGRIYLFVINFMGNNWKSVVENYSKFLGAIFIVTVYNAIIFFILFMLIKKKEEASSLKQI